MHNASQESVSIPEPEAAQAPRPLVDVALQAVCCSNRCRHCFIHHDLSPRHLTRRQISRWRDRLSDEADRAGVTVRLLVERTELLDHPRWREILADEGNDGLPRGLPTNGRQIAREPGLIGELMGRGIEWIQLTLCGADAATHDAFTQRQGSHNDVIAAGERAREAGMHVQWVYIASRPLSRVAEMSELTHALFGPQIDETIFLIKPQAAGAEVEHLRPTAADLADLPESLRESFATWYGAACEPEGELVEALAAGRRTIGCLESGLAPDHAVLTVHRNGTVYPGDCHETTVDYLLGNVKQEGLQAIIEGLSGDNPPRGVAVRRRGLPALAETYGDRDSDRLHSGCSLCRTLVARALNADAPMR